VIDYWTAERRRAAEPRDLVIDPAGRAYLKRRDGSLLPYGGQVTAADARGAAPLVQPSASNDTTPPSISGLDPATGAVIGSSYTFSAAVTDDTGLRSVSFVIRYPDAVTTQSFNPRMDADGRWRVTLSGFSDGNWSWWVEAKDTAPKGGNAARSDTVSFVVATSGGGGSSGSGNAVTNAAWNGSGVVQGAAGRLYFEMPNNARRKGPWVAYVCSASAVTDSTSGRSIVLTAAHCVYDDVNKAFARNVLFIPDQAGTTGDGTDSNCSNDPIGCWAPSFGVVDRNWTTRTFPDNIPWDYGFYAVPDSNAHAQGLVPSSDSLDAAAGALTIDFSHPVIDAFTHALGYSYSHDPQFMYCAENMTTEGAHNWWLPSCGLSGGSSGGPWMQTDIGDGPVMSLNSWGYTNSLGMAGPKLSGTSAECVFVMAKSLEWSQVPPTDGDAGWVQICP
jgi:hypothetical protein